MNKKLIIGAGIALAIIAGWGIFTIASLNKERAQLENSQPSPSAEATADVTVTTAEPVVSDQATETPSAAPTTEPTQVPSESPSTKPTETATPTTEPSASPTATPTETPTATPEPTPVATPTPTPVQTAAPTQEPTTQPVAAAYVFRNDRLLTQHYEKHGIEMGFSSKEAYQAAASAVITNPAALYKIEAEDGDGVYYIESTGEFVILSTDGYIRTYYIASKAYFDRQ
ncbi:MAG TPA: hypothetical protein DCP07_08575 [Lachnospiraceae bacterium]|nr:hypothetical protein [Lachnospiraceae bacterium]